MRFLNLVTTGTVALALSIIACSSNAPATDKDKDNDDGKSGSASTANGGSADRANPATTPPGVPPGTPQAVVHNACGSQPDGESCKTCCEESTPEIQQYETAYSAVDAKYKTCVCVPTVCANECGADWCAAGKDPSDDPTPGSACETCINGDKTDACDDQFQPEYDQLDSTPGGQAETACYEQCKALPGFTADDD